MALIQEKDRETSLSFFCSNLDLQPQQALVQ